MNLIKTKTQILTMQEGGKILRSILKKLKAMIKPGLKTMDLEIEFLRLCEEAKVVPSCKNYQTHGLPPFPTGLCISINDQAVHCYPQKGQILKEGDSIAVDTVIAFKGMHVDSAFSAVAGESDSETERFLEVTKMASSAGIKQAIAGNYVGDISYAIQTIMQLAGFNVLRDFVGHGIGTSMHELPDIPCYGKKGQGMKLQTGMTLAIETLACQGDPDIDYPGPDAWQTRMADGKKFAIFEHTVLVTDKEPIILTK